MLVDAAAFDSAMPIAMCAAVEAFGASTNIGGLFGGEIRGELERQSLVAR
jgi:hypothetical protein